MDSETSYREDQKEIIHLQDNISYFWSVFSNLVSTSMGSKLGLFLNILRSSLHFTIGKAYLERASSW